LFVELTFDYDPGETVEFDDFSLKDNHGNTYDDATKDLDGSAGTKTITLDNLSVRYFSDYVFSVNVTTTDAGTSS
jgi:hypothetical protein